MESAVATGRPPQPVLFEVGGQSKPALFNGLGANFFPGRQLDYGQLVRVVTAGGDERVSSIGSRQNVQRQIGQFDLPTDGCYAPAVGKQKTFGGRAGGGRRLVAFALVLRSCRIESQDQPDRTKNDGNEEAKDLAAVHAMRSRNY